MEKINIAELLKDCPKGMELDCTICDNVYFDEVTPHMIKCFTKDNVYNTIYFNHDGTYLTAQNAKCVIFPKGKTTWEGFKRPFKDGDIVFYNDTIAIFKEWGDETLFKTYVTKYLCCDSLIDTNVPLFGIRVRKEIRFATEEEKELLFNAIKDNGYKWNQDTKTLEKLVTIFKVGDKIKLKDVYAKKYNDFNTREITEIKQSHYILDDKEAMPLANQYLCELAPNKFDINTLVPFESRVLVRTNNKKWVAAFYSHYDKDSHLHHCVVGGLWYEQCIPYNDETKHLLDTTNDCDDFYKTWK